MWSPVDSRRGSLEFSDVGINFTAHLTERLRVGMQFFARKLGSVSNFNAKADWFCLAPPTSAGLLLTRRWSLLLLKTTAYF